MDTFKSKVVVSGFRCRLEEPGVSESLKKTTVFGGMEGQSYSPAKESHIYNQFTAQNCLCFPPRSEASKRV